MRNFLRFSAAPALALVLAACGGDTEEADAPADAAVEAAETALADGATAPAGKAGAPAGETDADAAGETVEPTPASSASATAAPDPATTPTRAAAATTPPAAFATCGVCHSVNAGENRIGPSLAGVVGRRSGSVSGATYSPAMQGANVTWTETNLERYLADPAAIAPGGTMPNPGLSADQRRAVIDYLKAL